MTLRLSSIIRKEFIQIIRDPRTLMLIIVMPILQLFLLGYAATTDVKNISLAVWDQSQTSRIARPYSMHFVRPTTFGSVTRSALRMNTAP